MHYKILIKLYKEILYNRCESLSNKQVISNKNCYIKIILYWYMKLKKSN